MPAAQNGNGLAPPTTLKRPRTDPPSPSSSSSPKRAASEDPIAALDSSSLPPSQAPPLHPSSPLSRMDVEDEHESTSEWVHRTGRVSLSETEHADAEMGDDTAAPDLRSTRDLYNIVMAALPPPFTAWSTFHLLPKAFFSALQHHAMSDAGEPVPPLSLESLLPPRETAVEVTELSRPGGRGTLRPSKINLWRIRAGLVEDEDFVFLASEGWDAIADFYSYPSDQPTLPRLCLPSGRVEIAPHVYKLHLVAPASASIPVPPAYPHPPLLITAPSNTTLQELMMFARNAFPGKVAVGSPLRLWVVDDAPNTLEIEAKDMITLGAREPASNQPSHRTTLADAGLADGDSIAVEVSVATAPGGKTQWTLAKDGTGKAIDKPVAVAAPAPLFSKPALYTAGNASSSGSSSSNNLVALATAGAAGKVQTRSQSRSRGSHGLVGLNNLGNTCFLASATQCLSNTNVLADYFLSGVYREELNPDNPLGMHGQVAEAFGEVVENLHNSAAHSSFSPRRLKATCSRFAPQFAGYGQHDTQEFLAFLLDGLHEDLNRIKKKPYIEMPDWKPGGGDRELVEHGKICWDGYKKRNDSVIVDLFQGQLQSTLVCPECHKESITMDPFMYLTVPLPIAQTRTFKLIFFPRDTERLPINVQLLVPVNASFSVLKDKLGALVNAKGSNIIGYDYWKGAPYTWFLDSDPNSEAKDHDTPVFHEVGAPVVANHKAVGTQPTDGSVTVPVYTFVRQDQARSSFSRDPYPSEGNHYPFFITLSKTEAADPAAVRAAIMRGYSRLVNPDSKAELWVSANSPHAKELDDDEDQAIDIHIDGAPRSSTESGRSSHREHLSPLAPLASLGNSTADLPRSHSSVSVHSQSGRLVARGDLFKVHVADASSAESNTGGSMSIFKSGNKDPSIHSFYKGSAQGAHNQWSSLDKRRASKRPMLQRISSSISNLVGSSPNSDDEGEEAAPAPTLPVIRPGEAIFVEWKAEDYQSFFPGGKEALPETEGIVDPAIAKEAAKKREGRSISLDDCLDEFSKEETLGQDDLWYCPVCKKHQAATKKLDIYKAPDILVICLKRFGSSRQLRDKLDHLVQFPAEGLDLDERVGERRVTKTLNLTPEEAKKYGIEHSTEPYIYDLYAVDNHFGGLGGGHYTAFCQNKEDSNWYNFDDSRVSKANVESVQSRAAYLLFYQRRTERRIGGISRIKAEEASRAATPLQSAPDSPVIAPSVPESAMVSSLNSAPGTPAQPSPVVSNSSSLDSDDDRPLGLSASGDLRSVGTKIGFGNTAWTTTTASAQHGSLPTPDSSDSEFVPVTDSTSGVSAPVSIRLPSQTASGEASESGLGEEYHVVRESDTSASDAEMVSVPRSPQSE
ncbi:hypothetical protein Q8F55_001756 [Vanrija albida]|uniref:ubiquitinyl hydrolase 1 n=1 Tax=Vanrija albida TaxID=181172 RepID=A0ABR3Q7V2_9TREE